MSFVAGSLARAVVRRSTPMVARRQIQSVPRLGTEAEMQTEAVAQIRARLAYQKELMEANPHKPHSEEWAEIWSWIRISIFVCGPICVFGVLKDAVFEVHHHRPEEPLPEYMGIRKKEFPWECGQCDFFDMDCWKKCRADKAAGKVV